MAIVRTSPRLSPRQHEVVALVATGCSDKEIARALGVSAATVKTYLTRVYRSNGFRNRAEAAVALASISPNGHTDGPRRDVPRKI